MMCQKRVAVVVPCFNEQQQIPGVIASMPAEVDAIVVIDDASTDSTAATVELARQKDPRVTLLRHAVNQGVGGASASSYKFARDQDYEIAVAMTGDGQIAPEDFGPWRDRDRAGMVDYASATAS